MNATFFVSSPLGGQHCPRTSPPANAPGKLVLVAGLVWIVILAWGFCMLAREEFTPVAGDAADVTFPADSSLTLSPDVPTLLLFAHPHCPCTRASLHELAELMVGTSHRAAVTVIFVLPKGVAPRWEQGDLWQQAATMPGLHLAVDREGQEANRFGVKGSGHVLLYQPSGRLVFSGGITPSRGHEGDNPGRSAVSGLIDQGHSAVNRAPVFGCPLLEPPTPLS